MKRLVFLVVVAGGLWLGFSAASASGDTLTSGGQVLGRPGYLIISAARDSTAGYRWSTAPESGQKSLVWDCGLLVLPDSLILEPFGADDLGVATAPGLRGSGGGGALAFRDGRFKIDQPLLLTDGLISLYIADGELEIRGAQIRYLPPGSDQKKSTTVADPRAGFLLMSGIVVLIVVLMRRARLHARKLKQ